MFLRCPWLSSYDSSVLTYSTALYFVLFHRILLDEITTYITRQTTVPIYARLSSPTVDLCRRFDRCQHAEHNVQPDPNFYRLRYKLLSHCCLSAVSTAGQGRPIPVSGWDWDWLTKLSRHVQLFNLWQTNKSSSQIIYRNCRWAAI